MEMKWKLSKNHEKDSFDFNKNDSRDPALSFNSIIFSKKF